MSQRFVEVASCYVLTMLAASRLDASCGNRTRVASRNSSTHSESMEILSRFPPLPTRDDLWEKTSLSSRSAHPTILTTVAPTPPAMGPAPGPFMDDDSPSSPRRAS